MINYCNQCGSTVSLAIPVGDHRERHCCGTCGHIQYCNPKVVVGVIGIWENRILLCKRAIEPRLGYWTLPAGFMENGESTMEGAARETLEEAGAAASDLQLYCLVNIPQISQIHLFYRGTISKGIHKPGEESQETSLFAENDLPWNDLAFESVRYCLERYFFEAKRGHFSYNETTIRLNNT